MVWNRYLEARPIGLIVAVYHVETENGRPRIFHKHYLTMPGAHPGGGGPLVRYRHYAVVVRTL